MPFLRLKLRWKRYRNTSSTAIRNAIVYGSRCVFELERLGTDNSPNSATID